APRRRDPGGGLSNGGTAARPGGRTPHDQPRGHRVPREAGATEVGRLVPGFPWTVSATRSVPGLQGEPGLRSEGDVRNAEAIRAYGVERRSGTRIVRAGPKQLREPSRGSPRPHDAEPVEPRHHVQSIGSGNRADE